MLQQKRLQVQKKKKNWFPRLFNYKFSLKLLLEGFFLTYIILQSSLMSFLRKRGAPLISSLFFLIQITVAYGETLMLMIYQGPNCNLVIHASHQCRQNDVMTCYTLDPWEYPQGLFSFAEGKKETVLIYSIIILISAHINLRYLAGFLSYIVFQISISGFFLFFSKIWNLNFQFC